MKSYKYNWYAGENELPIFFPFLIKLLLITQLK